MRRFEFDSILFPFNLATWHKGNFGPQVLQVAKDKGMGIMALKPMAERQWDSGEQRSIGMWYKPYAEMEDARTALRFALSHPITGALPPGNPDLFKMGVNIGLSFKPLERKESEEIKKMQFKGMPMFTHEG
jgi:predicted aldo/keto reductase-like oxidoreductase